ncbi:PREDICTED: partitioning defective protein 3-like [Acropora digitifera]|uniref:partitioning defective protein 3-like n=1 Tax=Acropora digitifera TaxID=70779 RepID=UPI00077AD6FC|nr:PREDICTED: partitioning defective protein 3-like [Acropora digitifera]
MKVTVCFEGVCVIVPCGNGDLTVRDLIQRSISRYRKATNKPADEFIQVNFLETSDDHGILDPDDLLCDVVDDKEKLVAIFEEGSTVHQVTQNGGCRTRDSSTGTASPDLSAPEDESPKFIKEPQSMKSIINKIENTNGGIKTSTRANRSPPPPVAPKPVRAVRHVSVSSRTSFNESIPSEDSGISMRDDQDRHRNGSDSSKSEISENVPLKQAIYRSKSGETTFAAVAMPIRKALYNGHLNGNKSRLSSNSSDQADAEHSEAEDEGFSLGRNSIRKSMFADSPMMDRWAELQEKRLFEVNNNREEQVSNVTSPSEPSSNEPDFGVKYDEKDSITSESSGEPDMLTIELKRDNSIEGLGFTVAGYRTADGRELGLIVRDISPSGCAARDGRLEIADRIVEVNGWSLMDIPNERLPGNDGLGFSITTRDNPAGGNAPIFVKSILPKGAAIIEGQLRGGDQIIEVNGQKINGKSQPEAVDILRNTRGLVKLLVQREEVVQSPRSPAIEVNEDSLRHLREQGLQVLTFKIPLDLSGAAGLGVSVKGKSHGTPDQGRDSPQDKGIFCKSIIPGGAAAKDGRLRPDDQLLRVNGKSLVGLTNQTAMGTLRVAMQSTRPGQAFIDVTIARAQEDTLSPPGALLNSRSLENLNAPDQERPIEAVSEAKAVDEPQNESSEAEGAPQTARLSSGEEDRFDGPTLNRNLAPLRPRNAVQRNDSYCVAVNKSRGSGGLFNGPLRPRPIHRPSPLAMENGRPQTIRANASAMTSTPVEASKPEDAPSDPTERPTSTVAMPTPPLGSTEERSSAPSSPSMGPSQELPPQPPPRWDSEADTSKVNFTLPSGLQLRLKPPDDQRLLGVGTTLNGTPAPPPPSQFSNQSPTMELPPSYDQALARLGKSPHTSVSSEPSTPSREQRKSWGEDTNSDANIIRPPSPFTTEDQTPFKRDGFGRMSMSEKRGRAALDARQSEYFIKREQEREAPDNRSEEDEEHEEKESDSSGVHPPLRRADSEELLREQFNKGSPEERRSLPHRIHKSKSTGQLKLLATKDSKNTSPLSCRRLGGLGPRSEVRVADVTLYCGLPTSTRMVEIFAYSLVLEKKSGGYGLHDMFFSFAGEVPNGHARVSPTDEEVPITMRSNADFTAVQQKLAVKKPFYKGLFKMGKAKRGDYSLTNNESPAFKHTYNKEALIDFPAEQRYRQLVNRYGQERASDGVSSLPSRGKKKHEAAKERAAPIERRTPPPPPAMKVSRVTVSAPTRV